MQQYLKHLGHQLRRLRKQADMTQAELAQRLGVNQSYIAKIESTKEEKQPTIEFLLLICDFFNVGLDDLLGIHKTGQIPPEPPDDLDLLPTDLREPLEQLIRRLAKERHAGAPAAPTPVQGANGVNQDAKKF